MSKIKIGSTTLNFSLHIYLMGILNVTPDSFSDGGSFQTVDAAVHHAKNMIRDGAAIIDIGGESTRPGAKEVSTEEELQRVLPVIKKLAQETTIPISIDTSKAEVAIQALNAGASLVNDITALQGDQKMAEVISEYDVPLCLMHMQGTPKTMQKHPTYGDIIQEITTFLQKQITYATRQGISQDNIIIDPGIGFGKRTGQGIEDNCEILHRLTELQTLNCPILVGASRKTFLGNITSSSLPVTDRLEGSLAAATIAAYNGANIIRSHDVKETRRCLDIVECVLKH